MPPPRGSCENCRHGPPLAAARLPRRDRDRPAGGGGSPPGEGDRPGRLPDRRGARRRPLALRDSRPPARGRPPTGRSTPRRWSCRPRTPGPRRSPPTRPRSRPPRSAPRSTRTSLCVRLEDMARAGAYLTTICPVDLGQPLKGLDIDPGRDDPRLRARPGVPAAPGSADGDWTAHGRRQGLGQLGNGFQRFQDAAVGNVQIPVALRARRGHGELRADARQRLQAELGLHRLLVAGAHVRGPAPLLRHDRPGPAGPAGGLHGADRPAAGAAEEGLRALGLGVRLRHLGRDRRAEGGAARGRLSARRLRARPQLVRRHRARTTPAESEMGRLDWDRGPGAAARPTIPISSPIRRGRIASYAEDDIGLVAIEESYIADTTEHLRRDAGGPHRLPAHRRALRSRAARTARRSSTSTGFWGIGRMIDWSDPDAGAWIHAERRLPQPRRARHHRALDRSRRARDASTGPPATTASRRRPPGARTSTRDVHNLYNLLWNKAIWDGYVADAGQRERPRRHVNPRPFIVTRSGAAGTQRYGAAMWSGDIAGNLESLATHMNAQMHMSLSGIDYYGADIGGFRREVMPVERQRRLLPRLPGRALHPVVRQRRLVRRAGPAAHRQRVRPRRTRPTPPRRTWSGHVA